MARGSQSTDREALQALYWSTGGPRWRNQRGWAECDPNLGAWHGVSLNENGRVVKLDLSKNALQGTIPAALGGLTELEYIRLSRNEITGPIPSTIGNIICLKYLDLGSNRLIGSIPNSFGRLTEIAKVDLSSNLLEGKIPGEMGHMRSLMMLWLESNHLEGPIPPELANIECLTDLDLSMNRVDCGRLQGEGLVKWRQSQRTQVPVLAFSVETALANMVLKDQEIFTLKEHIEVLRRENEELRRTRNTTTGISRAWYHG